jgi:hypothetical protein
MTGGGAAGCHSQRRAQKDGRSLLRRAVDLPMEAPVAEKIAIKLKYIPENTLDENPCISTLTRHGALNQNPFSYRFNIRGDDGVSNIFPIVFSFDFGTTNRHLRLW